MIVLHSQHHLTGITGDPEGHGEKTVAHRQCPGTFQCPGQKPPKQHEHAEGERAQRELKRIGLMVGARHAAAGEILLHLPDAVLTVLAALVVPVHDLTVIESVQHIQVGGDYPVHMPLTSMRSSSTSHSIVLQPSLDH